MTQTPELAKTVESLSFINLSSVLEGPNIHQNRLKQPDVQQLNQEVRAQVEARARFLEPHAWNIVQTATEFDYHNGYMVGDPGITLKGEVDGRPARVTLGTVSPEMHLKMVGNNRDKHRIEGPAPYSSEHIVGGKLRKPLLSEKPENWPDFGLSIDWDDSHTETIGFTDYTEQNPPPGSMGSPEHHRLTWSATVKKQVGDEQIEETISVGQEYGNSDLNGTLGISLYREKSSHLPDGRLIPGTIEDTEYLALTIPGNIERRRSAARMPLPEEIKPLPRGEKAVGVVMGSTLNYTADLNLLEDNGWRIHPVGDDHPDTKIEALKKVGIVGGGYDVPDFVRAFQMAKAAIPNLPKSA